MAPADASDALFLELMNVGAEKVTTVLLFYAQCSPVDAEKIYLQAAGGKTLKTALKFLKEQVCT